MTSLKDELQSEHVKFYQKNCESIFTLIWLTNCKAGTFQPFDAVRSKSDISNSPFNHIVEIQRTIIENGEILLFIIIIITIIEDELIQCYFLDEL